MEETVREATEAYLSSRGDLRSTTIAGYRLAAEKRVYGPYGDLPGCELPRIAAEIAAGGRDQLNAKAAKLLLAVARWMAARDAGGGAAGGPAAASRAG